MPFWPKPKRDRCACGGEIRGAAWPEPAWHGAIEELRRRLEQKRITGGRTRHWRTWWAYVDVSCKRWSGPQGPTGVCNPIETQDSVAWPEPGAGSFPVALTTPRADYGAHRASVAHRPCKGEHLFSVQWNLWGIGLGEKTSRIQGVSQYAP